MKFNAPIWNMSFIRNAGLVIDGIHLPVEWTMISCTPRNCKKEDIHLCVSAVFTTASRTRNNDDCVRSVRIGETDLLVNSQSNLLHFSRTKQLTLKVGLEFRQYCIHWMWKGGGKLCNLILLEFHRYAKSNFCCDVVLCGSGRVRGLLPLRICNCHWKATAATQPPMFWTNTAAILRHCYTM
jgi:hypothetical protein